MQDYSPRRIIVDCLEWIADLQPFWVFFTVMLSTFLGGAAALVLFIVATEGRALLIVPLALAVVVARAWYIALFRQPPHR